MRFFLHIPMLIALVACSSPGLKFAGVEPARVVVEGSVFDVYVVGEKARAIRLNFELLPKLAVTGSLAVAAIEQASGCGVVKGSVSGDQAMNEARLKC